MDTATAISNSEFILVRDASRITGYARDYISRLCRQNKVRAARVQKNWFVDLQSLQQFAESAQIAFETRRGQLSKEALAIKELHLKPIGVMRAVDISKAMGLEIAPLHKEPSVAEKLAAAFEAHDQKRVSRHNLLISRKSVHPYRSDYVSATDFKDRVVALALSFGFFFSLAAAMNPGAAVHTIAETAPTVVAIIDTGRAAVQSVAHYASTLPPIEASTLVGAASIPLPRSTEEAVNGLSATLADVDLQASVREIESATQYVFNVAADIQDGIYTYLHPQSRDLADGEAQPLGGEYFNIDYSYILSETGATTAL